MPQNIRAIRQRLLQIELLETRIVFDTTPFLDVIEVTRPQSIGAHHDDGTLIYDQRGLAYHYDGESMLLAKNGSASPISPISSIQLGSTNLPGLASSPPASLVVPAYHSNPSFTKKIYLDFDGEKVMGTAWNNEDYTGSYNTGAVIDAPPFSTDGVLTSFSTSELATIQEVWARVSEDYAPFQVDVTTVFPGEAAFVAGGQAIRVVISTDVDATTGRTWFPPAGGVAYLDSWYWTDGSPVWAFSNNLGNGFPKYVAEAVSHEVGHAFGLGHDGRSSPSEVYYQGHGTGATGWAPIMGVGYYRELAQWSKGDYSNANNLEDDLDIISQGAAFVLDDHGDVPGTATQLVVGTSGAIASSGILSTRLDQDAFRFGTQAGNISINVSPFDFATGKANLDAEVKLINSAGTVIATANGANALNATVTTAVPKGFYTLVVDGVGKSATSGHEGYSDYGSLGMYALSGTVIPNQAPVAVADFVGVGFGSSVLIHVLANDTDANADTLTIQSIGSPSVGSVALESGRVRYTPPIGYLGQATFSYTIQDEFGGTAVGLVTINVHTRVATRGTYYRGATGESASGSLANDKFPLLPGQSSSFANYTNYSLGLNGLIFDVAGLPGSTTNPQMLASLQFAQWNGISNIGFAALPALAIPTVNILGFVGSNSSARVQITFPNNTLQNTWLRITILANNTTKLPTNDVFYFGNVIGDLDIGNTATRLRVNGQDTNRILANQSTGANSAGVTNIFDLNRDGRVNGQDTNILLTNQRAGGIVAPITAPSLSPPPISPASMIAGPLPALLAPMSPAPISQVIVSDEKKIAMTDPDDLKGASRILALSSLANFNAAVPGLKLPSSDDVVSGDRKVEKSDRASVDDYFALVWDPIISIDFSWPMSKRDAF